MDIHKNFARSTLSGTLAAGATSFSVQAGEGARFFAGTQYVTIWDSTTYACADLDPNKEIVRISSRATDTFTIATGGRGKGGTSDVAHSTGGKTYTVQQCLIADEFDETLKRPSKRRTYGVDAALGASGNVSAYGTTAIANGTGSAINPTATEPAMVNYASAASSGSRYGIDANANTFLRTGRHNYFEAKVKLQEITVTRVWIGLSSQSAGTIVASDNPTGNHAMFRFSTAAGDTNWMCCTKDNTTQTATSSGIAADTAIHLFAIEFDDVAGNIKFYIDGVLVHTATANLPTAGSNFQYIIQGATQEAVAKNLRIAWCHIESDL
jgi:hypothetical protein